MQEKTLEEDLLGSGAIQFALELGRVKSMPDMPSVFYEAVEKSFIKYAKPAIEQAREEGRKEGLEQARHDYEILVNTVIKGERNKYKEELLSKLPKERVFKVQMWIGEMPIENRIDAGFNECLSLVKKLL